MGEIILVGSIWLAAFAVIVLIGIVRLEDNSKVLREVRDQMQRRKSCNESPEAPERLAIVPPTSALSSGAVAAVSPASLRPVPSVPYVGDDADDREAPEHSEVQGESRIRARARHDDTAGSWFPKDPDDAALPVTRRFPRVAIVNAANEDRTDRQGLPACSSCGSIDVRPQGGMFACNACGKLGALRRASIAPPPDSPHLSA